MKVQHVFLQTVPNPVDSIVLEQYYEAHPDTQTDHGLTRWPICGSSSSFLESPPPPFLLPPSALASPFPSPFFPGALVAAGGGAAGGGATDLAAGAAASLDLAEDCFSP